MSEEYARATCAFAIRLVIEGKRVVPTPETEVALLGGSHNQEKQLQSHLCASFVSSVALWWLPAR
jgi:hypothetical protein